MATASHVANFAARFCNELDNNRNYICSPLSVETVLAMVALGSGHESRAEIFKALDIPNEDNLRSIFTSLTTDLKSPSLLQYITSIFKSREEKVTLKIANKIYVKQGKDLRSDLKKDAIKVFNSGLEQIDFSKSSAAANTINNWVANQTNNIIKDLVSAQMLDRRTGMILINAIYFQGLWEIPFKHIDTFPGTFQISRTKDMHIKMMSLEDKSFNYKHSQELQAKMLQMFYKGGEASMVIVLPDEIEGVSEIVKRFSAGYDLMRELKSLRKTPLKIVIPKFKAESEINLKELLPKIGIKAIFDESKPDINMLSSDEGLFVSEAIQKAYIAVDEIGTEAAAATQIRRLCCGHWWHGETFIADRPFFYLLVTHDIPVFYGLFCGR